MAADSWKHVMRDPEYAGFLSGGDTVATREAIEGVWEAGERATVERVGAEDEPEAESDEAEGGDEGSDNDWNPDAPILVRFAGDENTAPRAIATQAWRLRRLGPDSEGTALRDHQGGDGGAESEQGGMDVDFDELPWQVG